MIFNYKERHKSRFTYVDVFIISIAANCLVISDQLWQWVLISLLEIVAIALSAFESVMNEY